MDYEKQLQLLGLPDKEARIYSHALSLVTFNVAQISARTSLKRPTCYLLLEELTKKGFVSRVPNIKKLHYRVEPPEVIVRQAENNVSFAHKLLPKLEEIYRKDTGMPNVRYYSGQKGVQNIFEDILKSGTKEFYSMGSITDLVEVVGDEFIRDFVLRRTKKKISVKNLRPPTKELEAPIHKATDKYLREIRFTEPHVEFANCICIYADKVAIISTKADNFAILIESKEVFRTHLTLFNALWQLSKPAK